jgi:hypothetical protein
MKIKSTLSILLLISSVAFQSCKKHEQGKTSYKTVDVTLDMNKPYQYSFDSNNSDLSITEQSRSFLVSELDKVTDVALFNYTPKANFVGIDEVQITAYEEEAEHHGGKGGHHPHGNCQNHSGNHHDKNKHDDDDDKTIYTFKIIVEQTIASPIVTAESKK